MEKDLSEVAVLVKDCDGQMPEELSADDRTFYTIMGLALKVHLDSITLDAKSDWAGLTSRMQTSFKMPKKLMPLYVRHLQNKEQCVLALLRIYCLNQLRPDLTDTWSNQFRAKILQPGFLPQAPPK